MTNTTIPDRPDETWVPPVRPEWVQRVIDEGAFMDIKGIVPLDAESLIATAKKNTGLSDFGDDLWYEPFTILVKAIDEEAEQHLMGRLLTRSHLLLLLEARLRIEDTYKKHPEIDDEVIKSPFFIIGQGRTGTSILQRIMAAGPDNGTFMTWESLMPYPPPEKATYLTDPRIEKVNNLVTQWARVAPELEYMHEYRGYLPTENPHIQAIGFRSPGLFAIYFGLVPSYQAYISKQDRALEYRYEKRVLKYLQWKNPRKYWILKSPYSLLEVPYILKVYPDVKIIWTHRDPIKAKASVVNLIGSRLRMVTNNVSGKFLAPFSRPDASAAMMSQPIDWIEQGILPKAQLCSIQYKDFVRDPVATIGEIYKYFHMEMTPETRAAMQKSVDDNPRENMPEYKYSAGSAETIRHERELFKRYQDYFSVASEV